MILSNLIPRLGLGVKLRFNQWNCLIFSANIWGVRLIRCNYPRRGESSNGEFSVGVLSGYQNMSYTDWQCSWSQIDLAVKRLQVFSEQYKCKLSLNLICFMVMKYNVLISQDII